MVDAIKSSESSWPDHTEPLKTTNRTSVQSRDLTRVYVNTMKLDSPRLNGCIRYTHTYCTLKGHGQ